MSLSDDAESAEHFTRRFESFTDVVFGFSLSFLAGRLVIPGRAHDVFAHPIGIAGFFVTFAFLAALWMLNHRMFRYYFAPGRIDIVLVFVELCGVALIPYALQIFLSFPGQSEGVLFYTTVYATILASSAVVGFRGFRRNWPKWNVETRIKRWRTPLIQAGVAAILFTAALLVAAGVPHAEYVYWLTLPIVAFVRRRRMLPSFALPTVDPAIRNAAGS